MPPGSFGNTILCNLHSETIARLHLRPVELPLRHPLESPGEPIRHIFFLETGIASCTTLFADGFEVEAGMYGNNSLSGNSAFMGTRESLNASYMQIAGHGYACEVENAAAEFQRGGCFQSLALRAVQAQFVQSMQSVGCNAHHQLGQRLARWLLLCADRTESSTFALSHEFLATMLGASRSTVTIAAGRLKRDGFIQYTRNSVHIIDRSGLEGCACECYTVLRSHLTNIFAYDSGLRNPPD